MTEQGQKLDIRLYALVDPQIAAGRDLGQLARTAADGGVTLIQYRDKDASTRQMVERARLIKEALEGSGVPLLINDRVDVALAAEADGVHLGQDDLAPHDARRLLGNQAIIGWTLKNADQIKAMAGQPLDYACIGGVFSTHHKDNADPPIGLDGLRRLRVLARQIAPHMPIAAIAGINSGNAAQVIEAGADGIAVIGAIFSGLDVGKSARHLRVTVDAALDRQGLWT